MFIVVVRLRPETFGYILVLLYTLYLLYDITIPAILPCSCFICKRYHISAHNEFNMKLGEEEYQVNKINSSISFEY
jgi:hypothetical protein